MPIITIGIGLAKNIFAVHGVNENGQPALIATNRGPRFMLRRIVGKRGLLFPVCFGVPSASHRCVSWPWFDRLGSLDSRGCGQEPVLQFNAGDHATRMMVRCFFSLLTGEGVGSSEA